MTICLEGDAFALDGRDGRATFGWRVALVRERVDGGKRMAQHGHDGGVERAK